MSSGCVSILMPAYNERPFVRRCIGRVLAAPLPDGLDRELIVVDDASTDGTWEILQELATAEPERVRLLRQERNQGKGAAIRRAARHMRGDVAIIQDADLEYDPNEYGRLLEPILSGHADVVYGSRFAASPRRRVLNYHHALANFVLTHLSNLTTGLNLTDVETCYKAFRADVLRTIPIRSNRFGFEPEITAKVAKRGCSVYEVPVSYHGRTYAEHKKIRWTDGAAALCTILKYWLLDDCYEERHGHDILRSLSGARRFNRWVVRSVEPSMGQRVLEVGSGIGNIARWLPKREKLTVSDRDPVYLEILEQAFRHYETVDVAELDLTRDGDFERVRGAYDTVVCLNVLEHIEDDEAALRRMRSALAPGGRLILVVPQHAWLMSPMDRQLGHHRRYRARSLCAKMRAAGFEIEKRRSLNAPGMAGWLVNAKLLRRRRLGRLQLKLFDLLVPLVRLVESVLPLPGLSLVAVGRAKEAEGAAP